MNPTFLVTLLANAVLADTDAAPPETAYASIVGLCISILRKRKGFSQAKLSEISKVSQTTISRIEIGEADITIHQLDSICTALDTSASFLIASSEKIRNMLYSAQIKVHSKSNIEIDAMSMISFGKKLLTGDVDAMKTMAIATITSLASSVIFEEEDK
jgi:transcriptional regulator with XRE-family HTH domain